MTKNMVNGIDLAALGEIISDFKADPQTAGFAFRSSTDWQNGAVVNSTFTGHKRSGVNSDRAKPHQPTASAGRSMSRFPWCTTA